MSELAEFIESTVEVEAPEEVTEEVTEELAEAPEVTEPEPQEEPQGSTTEPDKPEKTGEVPIAALLDEREKRQAYERELTQLRQQMAEKKAPVEVPDPLDNTDGFVGHIDQKLQGALSQTRIEMSQEFMRMTHEDYDSAEAKFVTMVQENPALAQQMQAATLPAKFVYDTVKKAEKLEQLQNVDEFEAKTRAELEAKLRTEIEAELKGKLEAEMTKEQSLTPSLAKQRAQGGNREVLTVADPLETTFNR